MPSTILSDNGASSGTAGIKTTGSNDGILALQTTTAGGTATTALTIDTSQNVGIGTTSPTGAGKILHLNNSGTSGADVTDLRFTTGTTGATSGDGVRIRLANAGDLDINNLEANAVLISTQNTERMRVPSAGGVQCVTTLSVGNATPSASGAGITFPATQSASTDANTLDDYEEGTFTPTYVGEGTAGTTTYSAQYGKYTKIGNTVTVWADITFSAATGSGSTVLGGLPFAVGINPKPVGSCQTNNINWSGGTSIAVFGGDNGTTTLKFYSSADDAGWTENQISNESGRIVYAITYWV